MNDNLGFFGLFLICAFFALLLRQWQRISRNVDDLHKYRDIQDVIDKYGAPDDVKDYGEYKKYTFKKSTNGWSHNKYRVNVFTLHNDRIIKHEYFQE
jgi:hypothetical protein